MICVSFRVLPFDMIKDDDENDNNNNNYSKDTVYTELLWPTSRI